jgi:plastocyanin
MEERKTQARKRAGGGASPPARWLPLSGAAALVALAVTAASAGGGTAAHSRLKTDASVEARDNFFMPSAVTINQGETVTWTNVGSNPHNVRFSDRTVGEPPAPDSSGWTVMRTFDAPGDYSYRCELHAGMTGIVTVNPAPPPPGGGPPPPAGGPPSPGGGPPPPGGTPPGSPTPAPGAGKSATAVTLQVSDATPIRGARVRFFGTVTPKRDGRFLQLQRRARGSFRTVLRIRLVDAGSSRSKFSKRVRVLGDAVFRARLPADSGHELGTSRARRLDVH